MLARWDPFEEMDWLTRSFFGDGNRRMERELTPAVDVFETDEELELRVELPGMKPGDVQIDIRDGVLTVSGERRLEHDEEREGYRRIERSYGRFSRSFTLPRHVDQEKVEAQMESGVLRLSLPKREEQRGRRIQITSGTRAEAPHRRIEVERQSKEEETRADEGQARDEKRAEA